MEFLMFEGMQYIIRRPEGYREGEKYPVLLFLHGAGTRGSDIRVLENNPFFKLTAQHADLPFVTVAPLCHSETWFDLFETLKRLVAMIQAADFADPDRIYLMGASMGGYGTWQLAISMPEAFAAIVPICGGGMYWDAGRLKKVPVWAFHGDSDPTVFPEESVKMVNAVNKRGGSAKLTVYPDTKHDAWTATYQNREVFEWLLSHCRYSEGAKSDNSYADAKNVG
jgi:predicted peptidase